MLAGIGVESQVAGNELDDPASGISLTPDQDENPWATSFDPGSRKFTPDNDRMTRSENLLLLPASDRYTGSKGDGISTTPSFITDTHSQKRHRQNSLKVLADVASTQSSSFVTTQTHLSSAPQTKAEQQRHMKNAEQQRIALQKFGKALIAECKADLSSDGTDLENVVLRVLSGTTVKGRDGNKATSGKISSGNLEPESPLLETVMTKTEALKASQAISNLIKQSKGSPFSRSRRSSRASSTDKLQCTHCEVTLARACDMKKHMKRHTKPYGCTYPKCHKRFGAKSDWKRHENSQHFQMECFRCQRTDMTVHNPCGELFQRLEGFKQHLVNEHKVNNGIDIQGEAKICRIGKNYQGQFWCGFCQAIVKLKARRNAAWDERFDHIDAHFNKEKRGIEQWLCVETRKTKGDTLKETDKTSFDEEDGDEDGEGEPDDGPSAAAGDEADQSCEAFGRPPPIPPPLPTLNDASRKRQYPTASLAQEPAPKRRRMDVDRYCVSRCALCRKNKTD